MQFSVLLTCIRHEVWPVVLRVGLLLRFLGELDGGDFWRHPGGGDGASCGVLRGPAGVLQRPGGSASCGVCPGGKASCGVVPVERPAGSDLAAMCPARSVPLLAPAVGDCSA